MDAQSPSLWREIADGRIKSPVLVLLTIVLAVLLAGAVMIGSYLLTAIVPEWSRVRAGRNMAVYVDDTVLAWLSVLASLVFVAATAWAWTRGPRRNHRMTYGLVGTLIVLTTTTLLAIACNELLGGDQELMVSGVIFIGVAALPLVWLRTARMSPKLQPWHNTTDGQLDLHCPACGYRMVGLKEARCPECGTTYTVDELLARQAFAPSTSKAAASVETV